MNTTELRPAGFGIRLAAMLIDNLVFSIALAPILMIFFEPTALTDEQIQTILQTQGILGLLDPGEVIFQQGIILVVTLFLWVRFAGTPGKRWLGLRVVDAKTGNNLTPIQSLLRYLGYFISSLPMGLGFFWVLFDARKQAWHDKIAGTVVVADKPKRRHAPDNSQNDAPAATKNDDDAFVA